MLTVYGIKSCDTCRRARKYLAGQDIEFGFHDVREDGLDIQMLERWAARIDWQKLLNKQSLTWRKIPEVDRNDMTKDKAFALMIDLQAIFCAGAWAATVVLAAAIVESQARLSGRRLGADLPDIDRKELVWLHRLRNKLLHEDPQGPVLTVEDQWSRRDLWQGHARRAVKIAFATLYAPLEGEKR